MAAVIQEETKRLARLVDNLLDLSRLEAGAAEPRREWTSIDELIRSAVADVGAGPDAFSALDRPRPAAGERRPGADGARARERARERATPLRRAPGVGARARGAAPAGRTRCRVRGRRDGAEPSASAASPRGQPPSGDRVIVRIVDRGPGIPPAQLERVFEPFYRAGTPGSGHRGSGLGLAIARGFTEANAGSLHVESLPGQGATFVFELPLEAPALSGGHARRGRLTVAARARGRRRAADRARAQGACCARRASRRCPRKPARRRSTSRPCARRTPRSSTSCSPTSTASPSRARCASGARCRSWCCRRSARRSRR